VHRRPGGDLSTRRELELGEDSLHVAVPGPGRDDQPVGDGTVAQTLSDELCREPNSTREVVHVSFDSPGFFHEVIVDDIEPTRTGSCDIADE